VCLFLGPYRNLTTLTASILQLHPQCQVLNHAGGRVLRDSNLNFLDGYSDEKLANFCGFALTASEEGARGAKGGSITRSHAFDHSVLRAAYERRYAGRPDKNDVCVVWKESALVSRYLRRRVDLPGLLTAAKRLRFLLPIRNPLDCTQSNVRLQASLSDGRTDPVEVLRRVLRDIRWFQQLAAAHPDRFYSFYEFEFGESVVNRLRTFLSIDEDEQWAEDAVACFRVIGASYEHPPSFVDAYERLVEELFADEPRTVDDLMRFASAASERD
jgi:hypothetical protein